MLKESLHAKMIHRTTKPKRVQNHAKVEAVEDHRGGSAAR